MASEWDATPHTACSGQSLQRWGGVREAGERRAVGGHDERQTRGQRCGSWAAGLSKLDKSVIATNDVCDQVFVIPDLA